MGGSDIVTVVLLVVLSLLGLVGFLRRMWRTIWRLAGGIAVGCVVLGVGGFCSLEFQPESPLSAYVQEGEIVPRLIDCVAGTCDYFTGFLKGGDGDAHLTTPSRPFIVDHGQ